jgi:hypothetical protein
MRRIFGLALMISCALAAQGRFEESKRLGLAYAKDGKFDKAAAKLEEVHEVEPGDAMVAEALVISYFNGDDRKDNLEIDKKGFAILEKSLAGGGRAVFLVQLNLSNSFLSANTAPTKFCNGRLTLSKGRLSFLCEKGDKPEENSFDVASSEIKELGERFDRGRGLFSLKIGKRAYNFYPASWDKKHSQYFLVLAKQYLQ